jgi:hypothetical protein
MKKIKIIILFIICLITTTCDKESLNSTCSDSYLKIQTLTNVSGLIGFDSVTNKYFINKSIDGTYDSFYTLYPCDLSEEYQQVTLKVKFSGNLYTGEDLPEPQFPGHEIYHIDVKEMILAPGR